MRPEPGAAAALAVCESLLTALEEKGALTEREVTDLLSDAASAHANAALEQGEGEHAALHREAASIINRMRKSENSVLAWTKPIRGRG